MLIDYFLIRANNRRFDKDCKVVPSEYLGTQHRLLVMDVKRRSSKVTKRNVEDHRVRWWNFTRENAAKLAEKIKAEDNWKQIGDTKTM